MVYPLRRQTQALAAIAGLWRPPLSPVRLSPLIARCLDAYARHFYHAHVTVYTPHTVRASPPLLADVFDHLLSNAVKYRQRSPLCITIHSQRDGTHVSVTLSDNGRGIASDEVDSMLRWGWRGALWPPGLGLGLPAARRLLAIQRGDLTLHSHPGTGTTVNIRLQADAL